MELKKIITITGQIVLKTGLHIGGSKDDIEIGGIDNPVIRHPLTKEPYIPGSSLKGKMRCLMEWYHKKVESDGKIHNCNQSDCLVCRIFGTTNKDWKYGPTRLIVRDAFLEENWKVENKEKNPFFTEEKLENTIDRITGRTIPGGLRRMERVPEGAVFDFEIALRVFDIDDESLLLKETAKALKLVELDTLGGSGSRGYGKIEFKDLVKHDGIKEKFELPENPFES